MFNRVIKPVAQPGLTTGWMFACTIQLVVNPVVQPAIVAKIRIAVVVHYVYILPFAAL